MIFSPFFNDFSPIRNSWSLPGPPHQAFPAVQFHSCKWFCQALYPDFHFPLCHWGQHSHSSTERLEATGQEHSSFLTTSKSCVTSFPLPPLTVKFSISSFALPPTFSHHLQGHLFYCYAIYYIFKYFLFLHSFWYSLIHVMYLEPI